MKKRLFEMWLMLQHHWLLFLVRLDPVARTAKLSPEESERIWKNIQREIRKIEEKEQEGRF